MKFTTNLAKKSTDQLLFDNCIILSINSLINIPYTSLAGLFLNQIFNDNKCELCKQENDAAEVLTTSFSFFTQL